VVQTNEPSETELTNRTIQRLIDGEDPLTVKEGLDQQLDTNLADRVFRAAFSRFHAARQSGTLDELQHSVYFARRPSVASQSRAGLNVLILGLAVTAFSYFSAPAGATFTIFVGLIAYGVWLLISS
jgi:hypothetical protein